MFSTAMAAASGLASYFGQTSANDANRDIANKSNVFSAQQAQKNREFQERLSNTSWQRGIADMRKAGINPLLSVTQGGASSPSGSSASGTTGAPQQDSVGKGVSSALQGATLKAQLDSLSSQTDLNKANSIKAAQEAILASNSSNRVIAETRRVKSEQPGRDVEEGIDKSTVGKILHWSDRILDTAGSAVSLFNPLGSAYRLLKSSSSRTPLPRGPGQPY